MILMQMAGATYLQVAGVAGREDLERAKESSWKEFFKDPSKWWDNRSSKRSLKQPDFKHRVTKEPLWMDSRDNPSWVTEELVRRGFAAEQCIGTVKNSSTADALFPSAIWACCKNKDLSRGTRIHNELRTRGLAETNYSDALITMYAKCGELHKAQSLLDKHSSSSIIPWTALISGYARQGQGHKALDCFEQMQHEGISPNSVTYVCILKACAVIGAIDKGKEIHDEISRQGFLEHHAELGGALVDMYAKCGDLRQAHSVLEKLPSRNVVSWSALIGGYAQREQGQQALECFEQMQREGIPPNAVTYVSILKACAVIGAIDRGEKIHDEISRQGLLKHDIVLCNALVDMYAKCGALLQARDVLEKLPSRNVVTWSALIAGYAQNGRGHQALECLEQMQREGTSPNPVTYMCILKACAAIGAIEKGKQIHEEISRQGFLKHDKMLGNALVDMYAKCGVLPQAQSILENLPFPDVVSWNALIGGYAQHGQGQQALECFEQMKHEGVHPDAVTYACILKACAVIGAIDKGKEIHYEISRQGFLQHSIVLAGALLDMYAKCGDLSRARSVLEKLPSREVVLWNTLIAGYAQEGQGEEALKCFEQMQSEGNLPDIVTFHCLLNLCSHLGLVEKGQQLFDSIGAKFGLKPDLECFACMVDLFGRAGHFVKAVEVIEGMPFSASSAIWLCLLSACRKWADVNTGAWAFEQAIELDKCDGAAYVLMVNIYAEAGMLEEAKDIEAMRVMNKAWKQPGCSSWTDCNNTVHEFCEDDTKHAQSKEIKFKLEEIACKMLQEGYFLNSNLFSRDLYGASKAQLLCHHSEKLALACALINTPKGDTIVIQKNMRMCGDCHTVTSFISRIEMRKIVVADANFHHRFEDGKCSCNGY